MRAALGPDHNIFNNLAGSAGLETADSVTEPAKDIGWALSKVTVDADTVSALCFTVSGQG